ncbi:MAG: Uracil-DNA glycosylase [candidate division TM6 bacterium GW2011_GWF2_30_66]|jgi:DNA polymerase|nr:MAG: Uracil-DNA glycosylase [candidate division TM6 bacterium GW2011_GWF2_30_66]
MEKEKNKTFMHKFEALEKLYKKYKNCQNCPLAKLGRKNIVFGEGNPNAKLIIVGEGPGEKEDAACKPFIGKSGQLLTKILEQTGLKREDVFITNTVKCRPPKNRNPKTEEIESCTKLLLLKQIDIIEPKVICTLGAIPARVFLGKKVNNLPIKITAIRGQIFKCGNLTIIPTYHPAYILRNNKELQNFTSDIILAKNFSI